MPIRTTYSSHNIINYCILLCHFPKSQKIDLYGWGNDKGENCNFINYYIKLVFLKLKGLKIE